MKKRIVFRITSVLLILFFLVKSLPCTEVKASGLQFNGFEYSAEKNCEISNVVTLNRENSSLNSKRAVKTRDYSITEISCSVELSLNDMSAEGILTIENEGTFISTAMLGTVEYYEELSGYVGVFDCMMKIEGKVEQVTVDMLYRNAEDNFTALTIGLADEEIPQIIFFGEYSEEISQLSLLNIEKKEKTNKNEVVDNDEYVMPTSENVDAVTVFQSTNTITSYGHKTVTISLYHAEELRNQASMSVYAKVNSHTDSFKEYLKEVHGYDALGSSLVVYPDSYKIEVIGADKYLHSNGTVTPDEDEVTQDITFVAYLPDLGLITFGIPITMSSTTIDYRGVATGAVYNDNIITWNVYKRYGWNSSEMDGDYSDGSGGVVEAGYTYEGNVTSEIETVMGAYGAVRYEYVYTVLGGSPMTLHMWTGNALCSNNLIIVP